MARGETGTINPKGANDPRFNPEDDAANARAHEDDEEGASSEEKKDKTRERVQSTVKAAIEDAHKFYTAELEPDQVKATDYYNGRPFGNEKANRSQVVSTDVRDITLSQIPSLLRIIWNDERAVEYRARRFEKEDEARQATDYARLVISEDNPGFLSTIAVLKDGLVRRLGYWKLWWEKEHRRETSEYEGLTEDEIHELGQDEDVEQIEATAQYEQTVDLGDGAGPQLLKLYDVRVTRTESEGRARIREVPSEEIGWTPDARDLETAACVYHRREVTVDYLLSRGFDSELVEEAVKKTRDLESDTLPNARQFHDGSTARFRSEESLDDSQRKVLFTEAYILIEIEEDYEEGDGKPRLAERRRFDCIGPDYEIGNGDGLGECVDEVPIVPFSPEPEPHTLVGLSNYDLIADIQLVNSQIERAQLDSLAEAVNPVTIVVAGEVNMTDLTKPDASRIVRVRRDVNAIREQKSTFVGPDSMPVLQYYKDKIQNRTGIDHGSAGLDADALQSTEKSAAASVLNAKQQRLELIARIYAETTLKPLYKKLLRMLVKHQNRPRMVRLRGKYVEVDPRAWDATMDVTVNVALGQGTPQDRIGLLGTVATAIQNAIQSGTPFVSNVELRRVLGRATELAGWHEDEFWKPWGPQEEQQYQQTMAQKPPPPSPEMAMVDIERGKAQSDAQLKAKELELKERALELEDDRERDRTSLEMALKLREIEAKYSVQISDSDIRAQIEAMRASMDAFVSSNADSLQHQRETQANQMEHDRAREATLLEHQREVAAAQQPDQGATQ